MVVVYGTVCRDRMHGVSRLPEPGGYVEIDWQRESVGGEAVNTALALQSWGQNIVLCGNSTGSPALDQMLESVGLSTAQLPPGDHPEPICDIYVTPDGQRTMFGIGFREMGDHSDSSLVPVSPGQWVTVDSNHGEAAWSVARRSQEAGMHVYVEDFVDDNPRCWDIWQSSTDWVAHRGDIQRNVRWLEDWVATKGAFAILSDGANGFVAGGETSFGDCRPVRHYPPFPCPQVVDSTGAGDVFRAGMLLGLSQGWELSKCLAFASAAGSLNCRSVGANLGLPAESDILALIRAHPEIARSYE
ncbi:MAG: carbohydrate kinase family protein [Armatimonadetes bacterium]|nr:carbohydrate kinase family protein [Armatimonadota bacterium]